LKCAAINFNTLMLSVHLIKTDKYPIENFS